MSSTAISANLLSQASPSYFHQRRADLQQLGQDLRSGDLSAAQQDFSNLQTLAQSGPFGGDAFQLSGRQQDFSALGQALQSGDLASAQQAYSQLQSTFDHLKRIPPPTADGAGSSSAGSSTSSTSPAGSEIVLNLGTLTPGEQISISIASGANGGEQVSVGISGQGLTPEQINFNLNPNSNQELVLNLFNNNGSSSSSSSSPQGSGLSVSA